MPPGAEKKDDGQRWISMSIAVEKEEWVADDTALSDQHQYESSCYGKGLNLKVEQRPGKGRVHHGELWNTAIVPPSAVGKSYFLEVVNHGEMALSCVMTTDGHPSPPRQLVRSDLTIRVLSKPQMEKKLQPANNGVDQAMPVPVVFFAKNSDYDFQEAGHTNRVEAMAQLQPTYQYQAWQEAVRKEYACIRIKLYLSVPHKTRQQRRIPSGSGTAEDLPMMVPVVDIKAAEKAVLATSFDGSMWACFTQGDESYSRGANFWVK